MDKDFQIEIIYSDKEDAEERLFRAFKYLLNVDDIVSSQYSEKE